MMEIKESQTSRNRQLAEKISKYCPALIGKYKQDNFDLRLSSLQFFHKKHMEFEILCKGHYSEFRGLFHDSWENLEINVYNLNYFDQIIKIGTEYEKLSGKKVTVVKKY